MEREEYTRLREHEERYWWHVGRREMLATVLARGVRRDGERRGVDIGCGTGSNFALLGPYGRFFGTEVVREACVSGSLRPPRPVVLARGEALPFGDGTLGLCTMFDVLEHVQEEDRMLSEVRRVLRPSGIVLLSVPAYMFLWSDHDVSLRHFRRYAKATLKRALVRNGLHPMRVTHAMASIFAPVALVRWLTRFRRAADGPRSSYVRTPAPLNVLLTGILCLEAAWLAHADLPFGTTLLALARKVDA